MVVLTILGILLFAYAVHSFTQWFNTYTQKVGKYQFFTTDYLIAYTVSYLLMFVGHMLMQGRWMDG